MGKKAGCKRIDLQLPLELVPILDSLVAAHNTSRSDVLAQLVANAADSSPTPQPAPEASTPLKKPSKTSVAFSRAVADAQRASQGRLDPITAATVVSATINALHGPTRANR